MVPFSCFGGRMEIKEALVKSEWKDFFSLKSIVFILLGNLVYAVAVVAFVIPNGLITGGTTGLSLFFNKQFGIPISSFVAVFNIAMFLIGLLVLGLKFALSTLLSTVLYPVLLELTQNISLLQGLTDDPLLAVILAGLMIGFGLGLVVKVGGSTGGMDIPPLVLNKKIGLSVSVGLYAFDFAILIIQMFFTNRESVLYGIVLVLIYTIVLDRVLLMGEKQMQVKIISNEYAKINDAILQQLNRGSTLLESQGGFERQDGYVVMSIVSKRELNQLQKIVSEVDPAAFMIINQVNEVRGRGFSMEKQYK